MQDERQKLAARMTPKAARLLLDLPLLRVRRLEEMRFYAGQNACFIFDGRSETQHVFFFSAGCGRAGNGALRLLALCV